MAARYKQKSATPLPASTAGTLPPQVTRVTRSASRDVEKFALLPLSGRLTRARAAKEASVQSDSGIYLHADLGPRPTETAATETTGPHQLDLSTVEEDVPEDNVTPPVEPLTQPDSEGRISIFSGTTAISSGTGIDAAMLEPELMVEDLPRLYHDSDNFLQAFVASLNDAAKIRQTLAELRIPNSKISRRFSGLGSHLLTSLDSFLVSQHDYISHKAVSRALFGPRDTDPLTSPYSGLNTVLFKANLAALVQNLLPLEPENDKDTLWSTMRELDRRFPVWFLTVVDEQAVPSGAGSSRLVKETCALAIEIRTQLAFLNMKKDLQRCRENSDSFEPHQVLADTFFELDYDDDAKSTLRGWETGWYGEAEGPMPQILQEKLQARYNGLLHYIREDMDDPTDLDDLAATHSWDKFIRVLITWARARNVEIDGLIADAGGITHLSKSLKQTLQDLPDASSTNLPALGKQERRKSKSSRKSLGRPSFDRNGIQFLKNMPDLGPNPLVKDFAQIEAPPPEDQQSQAEEGPDWLPPPNDNDKIIETEASLPQETVPEKSSTVPPGSFLARARAANEQKNKENLQRLTQKGQRPSFVDPQVGAERLEFGTGFDSQSTETASSSMVARRTVAATQGPRPVRTSQAPRSSEPGPSEAANSKKRPREEEDDDLDPTQDAGFERDQRPVDELRRVQAPPRKKGRLSAAFSSARIRSSRRSESAEAQQSPRRHASVSPIGEDEDANDSDDPSTYLQVHQLARRRTVMRAKKERRAKNPWTDEETKLLYKLQKRYPNEWETMSRILCPDRENVTRTGVDIKDKMRNIKKDWIKSGVKPWPPNLDKVSLGARMEKQLLDAGFTW